MADPQMARGRTVGRGENRLGKQTADRLARFTRVRGRRQPLAPDHLDHLSHVASLADCASLIGFL